MKSFLKKYKLQIISIVGFLSPFISFPIIISVLSGTSAIVGCFIAGIIGLEIFELLV